MSKNVIKLPENNKLLFRKFFKNLVFNLSKKTRFTDERKATNRISMIKEGRSVILIDGEVTTYRKISENLQKIYPHSKDYGKSYAEDALKDALWKVLESDKNPHESWKEGITLIESKYLIKLTEWDVYFPVSGIDFKKGTEWSFGKASFLKLNNRFIRKNLIKHPTYKLTGMNIEQISCFMHIQIQAADFYSAINLAKPIADLHTAILNALSDIGGSTKIDSTSSSYMEIGESIRSLSFAGKKDELGWSRCMSFNLAGFNPHLFRNNQFIREFGIRRISKGLKTSVNDLFQKRLFPSLKWMGKALSQKTNEEIFLYYCLAFEAILYEVAFEKDLVKKLKKRAYRLLFTVGNFLGSSIDSYNKFESLYDLRSAIVHRGGIEVTTNDILLMRNLVEGCLYKFFCSKSLFKIKTSNQLEDWLTN